MKKYYRLMLGKQHKYFNECYDNKYVGVGFDIEIDLKNDLPDNWREFNKKYIPFYLLLFLPLQYLLNQSYHHNLSHNKENHHLKHESLQHHS